MKLLCRVSLIDNKKNVTPQAIQSPQVSSPNSKKLKHKKKILMSTSQVNLSKNRDLEDIEKPASEMNRKGLLSLSQIDLPKYQTKHQQRVLPPSKVINTNPCGQNNLKLEKSQIITSYNLSKSNSRTQLQMLKQIRNASKTENSDKREQMASSDSEQQQNTLNLVVEL